MVAAPLPPLSAAQVEEFKRLGFLVIPGALEPDLLVQAQHLLWGSKHLGLARIPRLVRNDPTSWVGPFSAEEQALGEDTRTEEEKSSGVIAMTEVGSYHMRMREIGAAPLYIRLLPQRVWRWAEQLVGRGKLVYPDGDLPREMIPVDYRGAPRGQAQPAERKKFEGKACRGVYCTFPGAPPKVPEPAEIGGAGWQRWWQAQTAPGCHDDGYWGSSIRLGVVALLEDCPLVGGAFTVWPGSHARTFYKPTEAQQGNGNKSVAHIAELERIRRDTLGVECHGRAGTVVLWHPRLCHMAGPNRRHKIRVALLYDFHAKGGDKPPPAEMWDDWSDEVRLAALPKL
eukprot:COSAG01_NODE_2260_length_8057_cov_50.825527_2_plen_341_part_00